MAKGFGIVLILVALWLVVFFKFNLHCTQWTSFRIALLEMEPHVEEVIEQTPPKIYEAGYGIPIRIASGAVLMGFVALPGLALIGRPTSGYSLRYLLGMSAGFTLAVVALALSPSMVGERVQALAVVSLLVMVPGYFILLWLGRRRTP